LATTRFKHLAHLPGGLFAFV